MSSRKLKTYTLYGYSFCWKILNQSFFVPLNITLILLSNSLWISWIVSSFVLNVWQKVCFYIYLIKRFLIGIQRKWLESVNLYINMGLTDRFKATGVNRRRKSFLDFISPNQVTENSLQIWRGLPTQIRQDDSWVNFRIEDSRLHGKNHFELIWRAMNFPPWNFITQ